MIASVAIDRAKKDVEVDIEEVITELEHKVERLKVLYEQYFMGIEKIEPQTARKEVARKLIELTQMNMRNTAWRYRFHALNQKFSTYMTYWSRTLREIENGTYYRNIAKAGREAARKGVDVPDEILRTLPPLMRERIVKERERLAAYAVSQGKLPAPPPDPTTVTPPPSRATDAAFDQTIDALFDSMTSSGVRPAGVTPSSPPVAASRTRELPPGMDEDRVRELHRQYVQAQMATGQAAPVRYEQILATVVKQGAKILEAHAAKAVDFSVVLRDGKVILKATPKR